VRQGERRRRRAPQGGDLSSSTSLSDVTKVSRDKGDTLTGKMLREDERLTHEAVEHIVQDERASPARVHTGA